MDVLGTGMMIAWGVAAAALAWYAASVAGEVTYVTLADGRRQERSIPLIFKLLLPLAPNFFPLLKGRLFSQAVADADTLLIQGGYEGLVSGEEFVAIQLMLLWLPPKLWLYRAVKRRHMSIMKSLPFVLDLLTLSVEAGMDFISALQRNCKSRRLDPLNEELLRMTKEIQVGSSRKEALRNMALRVGQGDLKAVAFSLYFRGVKAEWGKISWPQKPQIVGETIIVFIVVVFFTLLIYIMDLVFKGILGLIPQ